MAVKYTRILPIWLMLVVGHMAAGHTYNFAEPEGTSYSNEAELASIVPKANSMVRLAALRAVLVENGLHAYIVPTADAHNSLQIAPADARRAWLTSFVGAAGTAIVTATEALVWTDGRYWTQFEIEADTSIWRLMREGIDVPIETWLVHNMASGSYVGIDPTTYTRTAWSTLQAALYPVNVTLQAIPNNLVDEVRRRLSDGPPARPNSLLITLGQDFTGRSSSNKIAEIIRQIQSVGASALILTALDDIAWTLNLRGSDIPFNPVFFSYLLIRADILTNNVILFWGDGNLNLPHLVAHQNAESQPIQGRPYNEIFIYLRDFATGLGPYGRIWVPATASHALFQAIESGAGATGNRIIIAPITPPALMKVVKNPIELQGMRRAHIRDGVAVIRALSWLDAQMAAQIPVTEVRMSDVLEERRRDEQHFMGPSFQSIVGAGANGAIIHYRPSKTGPQRIIIPTDMLLVDSGGQYRDGTTDITRTRHMGNCTEAQRRAFTRVLKGNIALATTLLPRGTMGHSVDVIARKYLWDIGLNYAHGTGHGVGHFLNIHEFPARIHPLPQPNDPGISPGMIYSNEPGYYEVGEYGIRHEDIVETVAITRTSNHPLASDLVGDFAGQGVVGFSAITQVPHQTSCLNVTLMTKFEIDYLNAFHARILHTIGPILQQRNLHAEYAWLERECRPISAAMLIKSTPFLTAIGILVMFLGM